MTALGTTEVASAPNNLQLQEHPLQIILDNSLLSLTQVSGKSELLSEIESVAKKYSISANKSIQVAKAESSLNQSAIGSAGERGLYQFMPKTWNWFNSLRNTNLNIYNVSHQIDMYCWAISSGYNSHWTTY